MDADNNNDGGGIHGLLSQSSSVKTTSLQFAMLDSGRRYARSTTRGR
jgi:hypothetical protein